MNEANTNALEALVTAAESLSGFQVQVCDGERGVNFITGTKLDGPAPVLFAAHYTERMNGTLDLRAQVMASDGEQLMLTTLDELLAWVRANR